MPEVKYLSVEQHSPNFSSTDSKNVSTNPTPDYTLKPNHKFSGDQPINVFIIQFLILTVTIQRKSGRHVSPPAN